MELSYTNIGTFASIASLILFVLSAVRSSVKRIKIDNLVREALYDEIFLESKSLFEKGSTYQKRQDISMYLNSKLQTSRNDERRWWFRGILLSIAMSAVVITSFNLLFFLYVVLSGEFTFLLKISIFFLLASTVVFVFFIRAYLNHLYRFEKMNDAFAQGFNDSLNVYMEKKFTDKKDA